MTPVQGLLARAKAAGITLQADGNQLRLSAVSPPDPAQLRDLIAAKSQLLALLTPKNETLSCAKNETPAGGEIAPTDTTPITAPPSITPGSVREELGRRKALARDIVAGIAAASDGDFIDPANFDDVDPGVVAERTAHLLDAQAAANNARQEAGRPRQATTPAPAGAAPSHPEAPPLLNAIHQAWPETVTSPAAIAPKVALPPDPSFDGLVQRLAAAMMTPRPWQRITDAARARAYFEARARHMLAATIGDRLALIEREERAAARRVSGADT
jgi:hypothetical protein